MYSRVLHLVTSTGFGGCVYAVLAHKYRGSFMQVNASEGKASPPESIYSWAAEEARRRKEVEEEEADEKENINKSFCWDESKGTYVDCSHVPSKACTNVNCNECNQASSKACKNVKYYQCNQASSKVDTNVDCSQASAGAGKKYNDCCKASAAGPEEKPTIKYSTDRCLSHGLFMTEREAREKQDLYDQQRQQRRTDHLHKLMEMYHTDYQKFAQVAKEEEEIPEKNKIYAHGNQDEPCVGEPMLQAQSGDRALYAEFPECQIDTFDYDDPCNLFKSSYGDNFYCEAGVNPSVEYHSDDDFDDQENVKVSPVKMEAKKKATYAWSTFKEVENKTPFRCTYTADAGNRSDKTDPKKVAIHSKPFSAIMMTPNPERKPCFIPEKDEDICFSPDVNICSSPEEDTYFSAEDDTYLSALEDTYHSPETGAYEMGTPEKRTLDSPKAKPIPRAFQSVEEKTYHGPDSKPEGRTTNVNLPKRTDEWDIHARRSQRASKAKDVDNKRQLPPTRPRLPIPKVAKEEAGSYLPCIPAKHREPKIISHGAAKPPSEICFPKGDLFPHIKLPIRSVLEFKDFLLCYDTQTKTPVWTLEHICKDSVKEMQWYPPSNKADDKIPKEFQAEKQDYWKAMNKFREMLVANVEFHPDNPEDVCVYTNIAPQATGGRTHGSKNLWTELQDYTLHLLKKHDDIWILSGALYLPVRNDMGAVVIKYDVLGKNKVAVPSHFFKVILATSKQTPGFRFECYKFKNAFTQDLDLRHYHVPRSELEDEAGFQIFDGVSDAEISIKYTDITFRAKPFKKPEPCPT
uniref:DNA/RNA non-specific endonuclease domain-containing protein n=1 Tax=Strigamia maritima TaxID=126957 RepID=T1IX17_STRMM